MGKEQMRQSCAKSKQVRPQRWPPFTRALLCLPEVSTDALMVDTAASVVLGEAEQGAPTGTEEAVREASDGAVEGMREARGQRARAAEPEGEGCPGAQGGGRTSGQEGSGQGWW